MARLIHPIGYRFTSASGSVLANGTLETYLANTSTPQAVYQNHEATAALPNPITLNAAGQAQNASGQTVAIFAPDVALRWVLKASDGTAVNTIDDDGGAAATTGSGGSVSGDGARRNWLSNGEMRLWQSSSELVDWTLDLSGATGTLARQSHTLGQTDVPGEPQYYARIVVTGSNADAGIYQDIHDVRTFAGQDVTASAYVRCSVMTTLRLALVQDFGSGGSPSADVTASTDFEVSANVWTRLEMPKALGSLAAKTLGTDDNSVLRFILTNPNNENFTLDFGGLQLEAGEEASALERRSESLDHLFAARPEFISINGTSPADAGVNLLINGGFDVWRRGASVSTGYGYTADQWRAVRDGGSGDITVSQQALAAASGVEGDPASALRVDPSALVGASEWRLYNYVEDVRRIGGQTVTVSFWAKASTGTPTVSVVLDQRFGAGGSSDVNGTVASVTLSTSWQRFTTSHTLASVSGNTIGPGSFTRVRVYGAPSALVDFAAFKLERGPVATPYVAPDPSEELARCQRYLQMLGDSGSAYATTLQALANTTTQLYAAITFSPPMRAAPTFTASGAFQALGRGDSFSITGWDAQQLTPQSTNLSITSSDLVAGSGYIVRANDDAGARLIFSAELE
jgi:hypothetical protein